MTENYYLRLATAKDISDILKIECLSFDNNICEEEKVFLERIKVFQDGFYVMEVNDAVVGYICSEIWNYQEITKDSSFSLGHSINKVHKPDGNELYISSMGMLPEFRGKGLGKVLFQKTTNNILEKYCKIKSEILIVSKKWFKARNIYKLSGFEEIHNIHDFFINKNNHKENGIVMRKYV